MQGFLGRDTAMMKITAVETLLRHRGKVRSTYFPDDFSVITSGVIHDDSLKELRWTQERNAAEAFSPDFHIPTDYPVYGNMEKETRLENIKKMMDGTEWMYEQLEDSEIKILPLVKGFSSEERAVCYETLRKLDIPYCAYYGAQYFGGKMGNGINKLNEDVREVVSELDVEGMLLIGLQSRNGLSKMPPEVVAAAGQRWIKKSGLRESSMSVAQQQYVQWRQNVENTLGGGQATLGSFADSSEVMVCG
ncbi:hypothetical protein ELS19_12475 [Halogeometricum borinquense]|uniref:tRNA-guanine(15) transglycosylase-like domain-containing protein n=2 Tax=Halogeometricum borinquense TaxID=60847 RepID=A0A482TEW9_9EURY|nr:hypothetical protein ELS19_12475 [Halogeometricum borinquense]